MNIPEIREKIKQQRLYEPIALIFIFILISLASFGLGHLSAAGTLKEGGGVTIIMPDGSIANNQDLLPYKNESAQKSESGGTATGTIFASKNGSTYYFSSCGSSSRIKEENKIWFTDETAAQSAGYRLAKACE